MDSLDDSLFLPSPEREVRDKIRNIALAPTKEVCFMDLTQLDKFMKQLNAVRVCATPGCKGNLVPLHLKRAGLGGAITIAYNCDGCTGQLALFETSAKYELGSNTEIGMSVLVAFIIAGCTHTTYLKVMKHALGVSTVPWEDFQSTLVRMYPVVTALVDSMCNDAKDDMRQMDQSKLGSWSRAVTSADGTWMTRGFHSKNATFSIRNYFNGAILYRKHLCQRGRDDVVKEELYQGTSKGAEGYAARQLFKKAKEEGMNIDVQWQDADSSSSKSVTDLFPDAKVMICGVHAGRAHKKQLKKLQKMKKFTVDLIKKYDKKFPSVGDVVCHCSMHRPGCGCLSDKFIERARNNFSFILSNSDSAEEFAGRIRELARHARDEHEWDGGRCTFHQLRVCTCKGCDDLQNLKCEGKEYHTRYPVSCPFHSLAYEIECHERAEASEQIVHPTLKRGHSNWLEASHNVFIRFRPKHIHLERLHYVVSTELALLQSNMTYMYHKRGPQYHWVTELFRLLKLPVFDGVESSLQTFNEQRMAELKRKMSSKNKKRRIQLIGERTKDAQRRKEWSKKHGHDTYGDDGSDDDAVEQKVKRKARPKKWQATTGGMCRACGSTSHQRSSHRDCPFSKKLPSTSDAWDRTSESDELSDVTSCSEGDVSSEDSVCSLDSGTCDAMGRPHNRDCPLSSRHLHGGRRLFSGSSGSADSGAVPEVSSGTTRLGKHEGPSDVKPSMAKKSKSSSPHFKVGDYACVHVSKLDGHHVLCRVVQVLNGGRYQLYCRAGILKNTCVGFELKTPCSDCKAISLQDWRVAPLCSLSQVASDPACLEVCTCILDKSTVNTPPTTDLTLDSNEEPVGSSDLDSSLQWVCNPLYILTISDREDVLSPSGWLSDKVIHSAQLLMLQQFPHILGLQPPVLEQTLSFQVHRGEFVQIICVGDNHWCTVSNIGCSEGEVKVYDSLFRTVSSHTLRIVASLVFSSASQLIVRMMDVERQSNGSDCGVLAIAFAYDICHGDDPCGIRYDHKSIRQHLAACLEKCSLSHFPVAGKRRSSSMRQKTQIVDLHCSCRLPEERGDKMAECDVCKTWYHQHCLDIPDSVFDDDSEVPWKCNACAKL